MNTTHSFFLSRLAYTNRTAECGPNHLLGAAGPAFVKSWVFDQDGEVVADTTRALQLVETTYPPAWYIPRADVRADMLGASATKTWCPYKGEASYHALESGGQRTPDALWVYETPFAAVAAIAGHLAFYPGRVERIEIIAAA